ncbi:hypothetical protein [Streptomyces sp. YIM S03343]
MQFATLEKARISVRPQWSAAVVAPQPPRAAESRREPPGAVESPPGSRREPLSATPADTAP